MESISMLQWKVKYQTYLNLTYPRSRWPLCESCHILVVHAQRSTSSSHIPRSLLPDLWWQCSASICFPGTCSSRLPLLVSSLHSLRRIPGGWRRSFRLTLKCIPGTRSRAILLPVGPWMHNQDLSLRLSNIAVIRFRCRMHMCWLQKALNIWSFKTIILI